MKNMFYFFPIMLLLVHCFNAGSVVSVTNFTTDQLALLAFKAHINTFDPQNILLHNWSASTSVCHWAGVSCGVRHRRVTALNLPNMSLVGTIPSYLGNLSFLVSLDLSHNNFHGFLPNELRQLYRLKFINLAYNYLSGNIPPWFGDLPKLQHLGLRNNNFTGTIPNPLFNMSNLELLSLSYNPIQGFIPNEIGQLSNLKILRMRQNQLSGTIPSAIYNMSSLREIDLSYNSLSDVLPNDMFDFFPKLEVLSLSSNELYGQLPSSLGKCKELQILSLSINKFIGQIPKSIGDLTKLKEIYLGSTNLEGEIPQEMGNLFGLEMFAAENISLTGPIPPAIFKISTLKQIRLHDNKLSGNIPDDMCNHLPKLELLELDMNELYGHLPSSLGKCSELQSLSLSENKFTGQIPKNIGNLTKLNGLYLGNNNLRGEIPHQIGNLYNLVNLSMGSNNLMGPIPSTIFNISTIKYISMHLNNLSGHLPSSIGFWVPNLEELRLWGNDLTGIIPDSISNASNLRKLVLGENSFFGPIPDTLGNLRRLQWLTLHGNNLTTKNSSHEWSFFSSLANCKDLSYLSIEENPLNGMLPISIGNLSVSLERFYAHGCKIKGNIPAEVGKLSNLIVLSLYNNDLIGSIPRTIRRLQKLQGLYLDDNNLEGFIPYDLCHLKMLDQLTLSHNKLYGPIPTCLSNLTSLRQLNLGSNNLSSTLPSILWSLTYILEVNLSANSFSGSLSADAGNLKVLTVFDLSKNQLSGNLPSSIGGLKDLQNLSFANNGFQGSIPQSFGDLISLEILDLSENILSGVIPRSLEALTKLKQFNVSSNRLEGEIPTEGPFKNFSAQSFLWNNGLCGSSQLQVPPCKSHTFQRSRKATSLVLKYSLPVIASATSAIALAIIFIRRRKQNTNMPNQEGLLPLTEWRRISYLELQQATNGFSESNLLGTGGFGSVYKASLSDGMSVALKVFNLELEGAFRSFDAECEVMCNIRHRNLLKIISSCSNIDFKALVLKFMPNGSLEKWLYSHNYFLNILQRLDIMIDVALGLEYLHHGNPTPVVHCDLKPSNVLLDEDMVAHVADFGIAKLLGEGESLKQTVTLATIGYMAPEYGSEGIVSTKGDVYSYGILLMETFTRRKPTNEMFTGEMTLKHWVKDSLSRSVIEVVDDNLLKREEESFNAKANCISSILILALDCSAELLEERRNMKDVSAILKKIKQKFLKDVA